jgi:hypothetical protein
MGGLQRLQRLFQRFCTALAACQLSQLPSKGATPPLTFPSAPAVTPSNGSRQVGGALPSTGNLELYGPPANRQTGEGALVPSNRQSSRQSCSRRAEYAARERRVEIGGIVPAHEQLRGLKIGG